MNGKILVVGGTGMLGRPVVRRLVHDGYRVRLMSHSPEKARRIFGDDIEMVVGDVTAPETLAAPLEGCEAVYINLGARMDPDLFEAVEHRGTVNIVKAARERDIGRIGMISALITGGVDSPYAYEAAKARAEMAVKAGGLPYTIFRCCWFFESLPLYIQGKKAIYIGKLPHPVSWISTGDFAAMVSRSFNTDEAADKTFMVRGIEKMTIPEALVKFCQVYDPAIKLSPIPLWAARLATLFSRRRQMKGLVQFMKYVGTVPEPEGNGEADKILGPALTTLTDWAEEYKAAKVILGTK